MRARLRPASCAALLACGALLLMAVSASASPTISEFSVSSTDAQAGGHPNVLARVRLAEPGAPEAARNMAVDLPPGVFGNPGAIGRCSALDFASNECGAGDQAGLVRLTANYEGTPNFILGTAPLYNLQVVSEDEVARLGLVVPTVNIPIVIPVTVRSASDYGLTLNISGVSQSIPPGLIEVAVWGFPADGTHDTERFHPGSPESPPGCPGSLSAGCIVAPYPQAGLTVHPYLDNPSVCTGSDLPVKLEVSSYQDPEHPAKAEASYPATTGCEAQKFDPVFNLGLTTEETDSPSGLDVQLKADQFLEGEAVSQSTLRSATIVLPKGLTINPDAADGQSECLDSEARFGTNLPGACPDNAKIGTVEVKTPALEEPLKGSLYFGEPKPGDQYRVFMIFDGEGIHAKLFADVRPDPLTGQLRMSVTDLPQIPFEEFDLHLFASDRGLMATPTHCTLYKADSELIPWNASLAPQRSQPYFGLTSGPHGAECPGQVRPFTPRLVAGTSNPLAGDFSSFTLQLEREDGDQFLGDLNFTMPYGFTGTLRGIDYCPEAQIAAAEANAGRSEQASPSCPASSFVGTTNVAAGPGSHPFHAVGRMYMAGPFKGAPLSLVAVTPALAGPYDYGVVVVRVALHIDPLTARVTAVSDKVPAIIGGVPIRMRQIRVNIDRERFTINPTNCSPFSVQSQGIGDQGTVADFSSYFQTVNCSRLAFAPKMTVRQLGGRKSSKRAKDPVLRFDLYTRPGDANVKSVAVTLPKAFEIDQEHLGNLCSRSELERDHCAGRQPIGWVRDENPLLDQPLQGPAYAVSGFASGHNVLPHLAFVLAGQVTVVPQGESHTVKGGRLQTVFPVLPDVSVGHFRLTLLGGKHGYIKNTRDLCAGPTRTVVAFTGQNGKTLTRKPKTKTPCKSARKQKRARRAHRRR